MRSQATRRADRREPASSYGKLPGYASAYKSSEVTMQLNKVQPLVLRVVLRDPIVPAKASAYLHELNRREFVDQTPARLLAIRHRAVRIEKLIRDLQVVAAKDEPIGL